VAVYLIPGQKEEIVHFKAAFNWREGRGRDSWD
jgi:hypothetical protein